MSVRTIRLAAVLAPAALLLHEAAYALHGGSLIGAHGYLELALPLIAAVALSLALAALVLPSLGVEGGPPARRAPFVLAAVLLAVFAGQELVEAFLLGGGPEGLAASASVAWLAPPLALLLGAVASGLIAALERTGALLADPAAAKRRLPRPVGAPAVPAGAPRAPSAACGGLAFGFARRPPPPHA